MSLLDEINEIDLDFDAVLAGKPVARLRFVAAGDVEERLRAGAFIYEMLKSIKDKIITMDPSNPETSVLADRLIEVVTKLLVKVFDTSPEEIQKGVAEFAEEMKNAR